MTQSNPISPVHRLVRVAGWLFVFFGLIAGVWGGWQMARALWPGLHDDAVLYSTTVINRAAGEGNCFAVYTTALMRRAGDTAVKSHGQLYQGSLAKWIGSPDYASLLRASHLANVAGFLLAFVVFFLCIRRTLEVSALTGALFALAGAYATGAALVFLQGRPDHGIPFVLLIFGLIRELRGGRQSADWVQGMQIGLVAAMSPLPGILFGCASVVALGLRTSESAPYFVGMLKMCIGTAVAWAVSTVLVYEGSLWELAVTTFFGAEAAYAGVAFSAFRGYWVNLPLIPAVGIVFATGLGVGIWLLGAALFAPGPWARKVLLLPGSFLLGFLIWRNGVASAGQNYSFIPFLPAVSWWTLENFGRFRAAVPALLGGLAGWVPAVVAAGLAISGAGYLRAGWLASLVEARGVTFAAAKERVDELKQSLQGNEVILIDGYIGARTAVVFDGPPWLFRSRPEVPLTEAEEMLGFRAKYYLVLQYGQSPPRREGFELLESAFSNEPVKLSGVQVASHAPGYSYAIYERIHETSAPSESR